MAVTDFDAALAGSPYLFPADQESLASLEALIVEEHVLRSKLAAVRRKLQSQNLGDEIQSVQISREIYESNRIEGVGPDLGRTHQILTSTTTAQGSEFDKEMFLDSLKGDPDLIAVLGLQERECLPSVSLRTSSAVARLARRICDLFTASFVRAKPRQADTSGGTSGSLAWTLTNPICR